MKLSVSASTHWDIDNLSNDVYITTYISLFWQINPKSWSLLKITWQTTRRQYGSNHSSLSTNEHYQNRTGKTSELNLGLVFPLHHLAPDVSKCQLNSNLDYKTDCSGQTCVTNCWRTELYLQLRAHTFIIYFRLYKRLMYLCFMWSPHGLVSLLSANHHD